MIPQNCRRKNLGDNVMKNWHRVKNIENELDCDSNEVEVEISVYTPIKIIISKP